MSEYTVQWAHLTSPQGESFQGFWVMRDHQPLNQQPYETREDALTARIALDKIDSIGQYLLTHDVPASQAASEAREQAFNTLDAAYRIIIRYRENRETQDRRLHEILLENGLQRRFRNRLQRFADSALELLKAWEAINEGESAGYPFDKSFDEVVAGITAWNNQAQETK